MDELKFVSKCLGFSILLMVLMQIEVKETTFEEYVEGALVNTKVSNFVNKAAHGGVQLIKDGYGSAKESFLDWKNSNGSKNTDNSMSSDDVGLEAGAGVKSPAVDVISSATESAITSAEEMADRATKIYENNLEAVRKIERLEKKTHSEFDLDKDDQE